MHLRLLLSCFAAAGLLTSAQAFDFGSALKSAKTSQEQPAQQKNASSLLGSLTSQLGITETQAAGGTSAILNDASNNMSSSDISKLTDAVPALGSFMGGNDRSSSSGLLGAVMSSQTVSDRFSALGLDPDMIQQFIPIILNYVQSEGGSDMMNLLKGAL